MASPTVPPLSGTRTHARRGGRRSCVGFLCVCGVGLVVIWSLVVCVSLPACPLSLVVWINELGGKKEGTDRVGGEEEEGDGAARGLGDGELQHREGLEARRGVAVVGVGDFGGGERVSWEGG